MIGAVVRARALAAATALASPAAAEPLPDKSALDQAIRDYILAHPEVIREALAKAEIAEQVNQTKAVLRDEKAAIYAHPELSIGASDPKVTIVEFFDFNCPYCRKSQPLVQSFLAKHPDTRVILKDTASFGKDSEAAARIAFAASKQGKYGALYEALMKVKGKVTEAVALDEARKLGIDLGQLKKDAASNETSDWLATTRALANRLNVAMTPLFLIGHNGIPGVPDDFEAKLETYVEDVRTSGCDVC